MHRPTVLHVVEHWSRPSERFVADLVRSTTSVRSVVATFHRTPMPPPGVASRVWDLSACRHVPPADPQSQLRPAPRWLKPLAAVPGHVALAGVAALERTAVVHAHFGQMAFTGWRVARKLGLPLAVSVHGWDVLVGARQDPAIGLGLRGADLVVTPSEFLASAVRGLGVTDDVIRVVPSGVDLAEFPWTPVAPTTGPPVVTFAGRFTEKKGVLDAAHALARVAATRAVQVRFVGYGPLEPELRRVVAALQLPASIVDGRAPGAVQQAIRESSLVVTASRTAPDGDAETLCLVNLEAQACGRPLVTTANGGIPEAVDPDAAVVVADTGDIVGALVDAVERVLDAPTRWPAMGHAGRRFVARRFELGARTADMERLWRSLWQGSRAGDLPRAQRCVDLPRTSVVLVTHNRRQLLERTLDALAAQTRPADEVIVVDNGSDDGTAALLEGRRAAQSPAGLKVLTRPANLPVAGGRNLAVAASTGDVVAFTDDDCRPRPTWLEAILAGFAADVGIVQGRTTADPSQPLAALSRTQWTPAEFGLYETCNIAYRRSALVAAASVDGPFDLGFARTVAATLGERWARYPFGEDTELAWRVKRAGVASRFAVHAVVDHEVFAPDRVLLLRRAALAAAFPVLVGEVPELREVFLWHRFFLGPHRGRFWVAAGSVAVAAACRRRTPLLGALPYTVDVAGLRQMRARGGRRDRLLATATLVRRDLAETAALLRGSRKARTLVL